MHTGSYVDPRRGDRERHAAAMRQVREGLLPLLDAVADDDAPVAAARADRRQGRSLCAGVEDLEPYLAALDHHPKAGICLDTCHVFAAGPRSTSPAARPPPSTGSSRSAGRAGCGWCTPTTRWTSAARSRTGTSGSARATSAPARSRELLAHPATAGVPFILETPGSRDAGRPRHRRCSRSCAVDVSERAGPPCSPPRALLGITACLGQRRSS